MPFGYPVMLELGGQRVVVIGDDAVREGKVDGQLAAGAEDVQVVADGPDPRREWCVFASSPPSGNDAQCRAGNNMRR